MNHSTLTTTAPHVTQGSASFLPDLTDAERALLLASPGRVDQTWPRQHAATVRRRLARRLLVHLDGTKTTGGLEFAQALREEKRPEPTLKLRRPRKLDRRAARTAVS